MNIAMRREQITREYIAYLISIGMRPRDAEAMREAVRSAADERLKEVIEEHVRRRFIRGEG